MLNRTTEWNAKAFFRSLTEKNKLAKEKGFVYVEVSGLEGMEEALARMQSTPNFVFVQDNAAGYTELEHTPHIRRMRTVFFAMRHKLGDMNAHQECLATINDLHRQFCSKLLQERTRLQENMQYLDSRITLQEVSRYLVPGTAICMFEIAVDTFIDLSYNPEEWE